ncbi:histidine phosphatase family protein [Rhodopseudomonas sp. B29]|uniref:histidine phosphatase family protein n=1 Tax=Rhodopseudomonas sp. B29 TaxID=95607 RepID=UPI0004CF1683|nr:histidine phosphatase family protein [Rhodopseudomonas sp. B29]
MSAAPPADKPFVAQHAVQPGVVATRWWWVRHAPVRSDGGNIYGQIDIDCDCSDKVVFDAVGRVLPKTAVWYASKLKRTHMTAEAIFAAGFPRPAEIIQDADLNEQHLGDWQGTNRQAFFAKQPIDLDTFWFAPIDEPAPNGESFMDLYRRTQRAIARITAAHPGQDIVAVAHGGTIKAAIGVALHDQPSRGLAFTIDNCSITRLDHMAYQSQEGWRIPMVNQQPWIADPSHAAMHQPAGAEVATNSTKLA